MVGFLREMDGFLKSVGGLLGRDGWLFGGDGWVLERDYCPFLERRLAFGEFPPCGERLLASGER